MKAIILSAGQGRRLLPLTRRLPKCMLPVLGRQPVLEHQLRALARVGVEHAEVLVGFGAEHVERFVAEHPVPGIAVRTRFNPLYATTDNLITAWFATAEIREDFLLLNGDTLFDSGVPRKLLAPGNETVRIAVDRKASYDDDDMKVVLRGDRRVSAIGKKLDRDVANGEAIGLSVFRGEGVAAVQAAFDLAVRHPEALHAWYPPVLAQLAETHPVHGVSIHGMWWTEIDSQDDLEGARSALASQHTAADGVAAARSPKA